MRLGKTLREAVTHGGVSRTRTSLHETIELTRRYLVQETIAPLRNLGRLLAYGLAGSVLAAIGSIFVLVGVLRLLETETGGAFAGSWSFAPFLLTAALGAGLIGGIVLLGVRLAGGKGS